MFFKGNLWIAVFFFRVKLFWTFSHWQRLEISGVQVQLDLTTHHPRCNFPCHHHVITWPEKLSAKPSFTPMASWMMGRSNLLNLTMKPWRFPGSDQAIARFFERNPIINHLRKVSNSCKSCDNKNRQKRKYYHPTLTDEDFFHHHFFSLPNCEGLQPAWTQTVLSNNDLKGFHSAAPLSCSDFKSQES